MSSEKHQEILRQAKALFLETGFDRTTMDGIAKAAKVSKPTLYNHFTDKSSLFLEVIQHVGQWVEQQWPAVCPEHTRPARLNRFATALHGVLSSPNALAFLRLVIHETARDPSVGQAYDRLVEQPMIDHVYALLRDGQSVPTRVERDAAETFIALIREPWLSRALTSGEPPTKHRLNTVKRRAIKQFNLLYPPR